MTVRTPAARIAHAKKLLGVKHYSGWCEKFVREAFGFPARHASATLAWNATKRRHSDIKRAPAGVPIFWELHRANKNHGLGHVALSIGGGECITTSYGPGGAIARVGIERLTADWQMTVRGWSEDYHGQIIWKGKAPGGGRHVISERNLRGFLGKTSTPKATGLKTWCKRWQQRQKYAPGLIADGVYGQASDAHATWTKRLQTVMKTWKGDRDTGIDGDLFTASVARVREIQSRNHGDAYPGALDGVPGPVFCKMLGIPPHPGL